MGQPTIACETTAVRNAVFRPGPRIHLRQRIVTDKGARCEELLAQERHSLNSDASCAVSETVALAHLLPETSAVVAERDLVVRVGLGCEAPGTPDGAAYLACGGMHAVQVVRADVGCERRGRCARLLRVFLAKVVKSTAWLLASSVGDGIVVFTIAMWVPRALERRTLAALRRALRRSPAVDARFEFELLAPATRRLRDAVFPELFGTCVRRAHRTTRSLVDELRGLALRAAARGATGDDDDDVGAALAGMFLC